MKKLTRLKEVRLKQDMSQQALAEKTGLSLSTISNYETGKFKPTLNNAKIVAKALHVKPEDLVENEL